MTLVVVPATLVTVASVDPFLVATAIILAAFLAGGTHSVLERHKAMEKELGQRITFAGMARLDALTALPNRLALREWFDAQAAGGDPVAVHYLDLNDFKPVNDRFGHPAGDEMLRMVSTRLARMLRTGDIAARLGGDEFVVIQSRLDHPDEAAFLAQRLCRAIATPFNIEDRHVRISTSVGYVTSAGGEDLELLLSLADEALYAAKRSGADMVCFDRHREPRDSLMAA